MTSIAAAAPQFLVEKLSDSLRFYEQRLGFACDFVYEDFYAGVSRDRAIIHLKCAPSVSHRAASDGQSIARQVPAERVQLELQGAPE